MWTARRILRELADPAERREALISFWRHEEPATRGLALAELARALRFREKSLRQHPVEKKAELLGMRFGDPAFEPYFERALTTHLTHEGRAPVEALLDHWQIPHQNGVIEEEDVAPTAEQVRDGLAAVADRFDRRAVLVYLAAAGLVMGEAWRNATWPVVDEELSSLGS